jgi:phosphohistidine phosphatase
MQYLILMRHAKAEAQAQSGEDFDRALSARGLNEAKAVAEALKASGLKPDLALVSSSARTQGTFDQIRAVFGDIKADLSDTYYNADSHILRHAIEAHEEQADCVLVIAHNPGLSFLVGEYLDEGAAGLDLRQRVVSSYPTATATVFKVDVAGRPLYEGLYLAKTLLGA